LATNDNIVLTKGNYTVTLFTTDIAENWKNLLKIVPGITSKDNQINAPNKSRVIDLQRSNYNYVISGYITKSATQTAKQIKDDLRIIFEGSRQSGGPIILTYEDNSINVFFEDCVVKKIINDDTVTNYTGDDSAEYNVTVTLVEGDEV